MALMMVMRMIRGYISRIYVKVNPAFATVATLP